MRGTILVPTTVAAALRARHMLVAMSLAALLVLALAAPVAAQEEETTSGAQTVAEGKQASDKQEQSVQGGQQAENEAQSDDERAAGRAAESLQGAEALMINGGSNATPDSIEIEAVGCEVEEKGAVVTVKGQDSPSEASFTNAPDTTRDAGQIEATIEPVADQLIVEVGDGFPTRFGPEGASEEVGKVTSSTGITCDRAAAANTENENDGDETDADETRTADELASLSCDELLVLFRAESSSGQQQYEDAAAFTDSAVRAQVEVCLKKEIVNAPDDDLPDTGGLSLLALGVLGVVSAAAGLSVIRGGPR